MDEKPEDYFNHEWPTDQGQHVWSDWQTHTHKPPVSTQYRTCVGKGCKAVEYRDTPKG